MGVQKVGTLSTFYWLDRSWVGISMLQPCNGSKEKTHRIVGDRLHISYIHQLPQMRTFPAWDKHKQSQTSPLKEDFRQLPGHITGQVFQTTWSQRVIPQWLSNNASKIIQIWLSLIIYHVLTLFCRWYDSYSLSLVLCTIDPLFCLWIQFLLLWLVKCLLISLTLSGTLSCSSSLNLLCFAF